jgi:hypothetical protein
MIIVTIVPEITFPNHRQQSAKTFSSNTVSFRCRVQSTKAPTGNWSAVKALFAHYSLHRMRMQRKRKVENVFASSSIYETFSPFSILLCFCGSWHNGRKHNVSLESIKILLSILYSLFFAVYSFRMLYGANRSPNRQTLFSSNMAGTNYIWLHYSSCPLSFRAIFIVGVRFASVCS